MEEQAEYKICKCHACGGRMLAAEFSQTVNMRIDGQLHAVGVRRVPCHKCEDCGTSVTDASADEYYNYHYNKYCNENGLNTPYLKFRRRVLRFFRCWYDRIMRDYCRSMRKFRKETT
jgi:YgiT-type zinc finger domain-containing protein